MVKFLQAERGQALVIMVFAIIGLLVMLGLAIDGGTVFLERRRMQNAADAAALAGTRLLAEAICGDPGADDAAIAAEVNGYAESNGVEDPDNNATADYVDFDEVVLGRVGDGTIPNGATGISATVEINRPTYFMTLVGIDTAGASADALAMTGPPLLAGGMRPFGIPLQVMQQTPVGDCFTISFKNCDDNKPDDCLIKDDNGDTIGHHRNWLNLNHVWNQGENPNFPRATGSSGNANDLKDWMENGWDGTLYADCFWSEGCQWGDFIHAKPGTNSSPIGHVPINTAFFVPIFDIVPHYDQIPEPKAGSVPQGSNYYYHIVGFAAVRVPTGGDANQGGGTIRACVEEVIMGEGQPSPNTGFGSDACATHTMVVSLWR